MEKSIWFGGILPTELTMTTMMMKRSCSLAMIVGITPFVNPTPVVQNVVPNLSMMMRMITRNPHLAEVVLQAVALEPLHPVVQVAAQVGPLEVQVAVQVDLPEAHLVARVAALPVEVLAAALPVEAPRVALRSVRAHHVD